MNRACQRQTAVVDVPVAAMMAFVPTPSALSSTIRARQTCFCNVYRSLTKAPSRRRSASTGVMEIPVRMPRLARANDNGNPQQDSSASVNPRGPRCLIAYLGRRGDRPSTACGLQAVSFAWASAMIAWISLRQEPQLVPAFNASPTASTLIA